MKDRTKIAIAKIRVDGVITPNIPLLGNGWPNTLVNESKEYEVPIQFERMYAREATYMQDLFKQGSHIQTFINIRGGCFYFDVFNYAKFLTIRK